jgi:hypothetical protein
MDQSLSMYLLETLLLLDREAPDYPLRLLTLAESILEDPDIILRKQLDKIKTQKMAEMKMEGIPFDERIEELDKLEYPKPDRDFIYTTFNDFADRHPWVGQENIRPKSIVREMFESFSSFGDYIRSYDLHRAEGLLLRHINSVYGVLAQTVPDSAKTDAVREMELYLGTMIRQVDSSLLEEWEKMRDPSYQVLETKEMRPSGAEEQERDITRDEKTFTALIRTRIFAFLAALIKKNFQGALEILDEHRQSSPEEASGEIPTAPDTEGNLWTGERLKGALEAYYLEHQMIRLDPDARNIRHTYVKPSEDKNTWNVQQMIVDPDDENDWVVEFEVDLVKSRAAAEVAMRLVLWNRMDAL